MVIPNSWGSGLKEFNPNHEPAGSSKGGQFASRSFTSEEGYVWHETGPVRAWAERLNNQDLHAIGDYASLGYSSINSTLRGNPPTHDAVLRLATQEERKAIINAPIGRSRPTPPEGGTARFDFDSTAGGWVVKDTRVDSARVEQNTADADNINRILDKWGYELPENIEVYRAVYLPGKSEADIAAMQGGTFYEPGFTSTMVGDAGGRLSGYIGWGKWESIHKRFGKIAPHVNEVGAALRLTISIPKGSRVLPVEAVRQEADRRLSLMSSIRYGFPVRNDVEKRRTESELLLGSGSVFRVDSVKPGGSYKGMDPSLPPVQYLDVKLTYQGRKK